MFFKSKKTISEPKVLEKWHALGNDFLITKHDFNKEEIISLSDRNIGIGCDQFIIFQEDRVRFFNADGSESGMCGNALKCLTKIASRETMLGDDKKSNQKKEFRFKLPGGYINTKLDDAGFSEIEILPPLKFKEEGNPFLHLKFPEFNFKQSGYNFVEMLKNPQNSHFFVDLGNPHFITIINLSDADPLLQRRLFDSFLSYNHISEVINFAGEFLQKEFLKTSGINASFVLIESASEAYVRTFERGVGETLSCGSGSCASAFAGVKLGALNPKNIKVFNRGSEKVLAIKESYHLITITEENKILLKGTGIKVASVILN